uniref:RING-type domain-containing protein n=1 Tax=Periophthalmus magnuspinnatus TaxID=409849 RepID=A0A3B4A5A5_9GOBI
MELLECPLCLFLMVEPVTVSCGHTFCRRCVWTFLPSKCPQCKDKLKPRDTRAMKNNKLKAGQFVEALRITNEGLDQGKSHRAVRKTHTLRTYVLFWCLIFKSG